MTVLPLVVSTALFVGVPGQAAAQRSQVSGIIDQDQTWSGVIELTDDVSIEEATVSVLPGTVIDFGSNDPKSPRTLRIGSRSKSGWLRLQGTRQNPIQVKADSATAAGLISAYFHEPRSNHSKERASNDSNAMQWTYVTFTDLCPKRFAPPRSIIAGSSRPTTALEITLAEDVSRFSITNCEFVRCSDVTITYEGPCRLEVADCRFSNPKGYRSLSAGGGYRSEARGATVIRKVHSEGALHCSGHNLTVEENVIVGEKASLSFSRGRGQSLVENNYVHITSRSRRFQTAIHCSDSDGLISKNIVRGGWACIEPGVRYLRFNVFISEPGERQQFRESGTYYLVSGLPSGAILENNLFLGPAQGMIFPWWGDTQTWPLPPPVVIRNNVFDGYGDCAVAVLLDGERHPKPPVEVFNNLVLRTGAILDYRMGIGTTRVFADFNAVFPTLREPHHVSEDGVAQHVPDHWGKNDLAVADESQLGLAGRLPDKLPEFEPELIARTKSVEDVRKMLFRLYELKSSSPLSRAGRKSEANNRPIGIETPAKE